MSETGKPMLVDSHCHLNYKGLDDDLEGVLGRAREAGVGAMLAINTRISEFDDVIGIARAHDDIFASVGVHPHQAEEEAHTPLDALLARAEDPLVIGIGETGLDYYYDNAPRELQRENFRTHIAAARQTGLPVIVHTRDADDESAAILREEMAAGAFTGVIHCFTASQGFAETALDLGLYISLSGIVTFRNAVALQETAKTVPLERLLVETDAPFLAPVPHRGKTCEPAFVADTARFVADLRGIAFEELARVTTENFFTLFSKAGRRHAAA